MISKSFGVSGRAGGEANGDAQDDERERRKSDRNYPHPNFEMAVSLAQLGRLDEAHSAVKAGLALNPAFAISRARALGMAMSDDPTFLAQLELYFVGLRKAGNARAMTAARRALDTIQGGLINAPGVGWIDDFPRVGRKNLRGTEKAQLMLGGG